MILPAGSGTGSFILEHPARRRKINVKKMLFILI
jgi:hypothetical protein